MCEGGGNSPKYIKRGWNRKEGRGHKDFKKGGQAGSGGGCLKKGGLEPPYKLCNSVREYHQSVLSNVEINNCKVAPPPKVQLNKNNISKVQSAILKVFKESNDDKNPYAMLDKHYGKQYSIMHGSIQKSFQGIKWINIKLYLPIIMLLMFHGV